MIFSWQKISIIISYLNFWNSLLKWHSTLTQRVFCYLWASSYRLRILPVWRTQIRLSDLRHHISCTWLKLLLSMASFVCCIRPPTLTTLRSGRERSRGENATSAYKSPAVHGFTEIRFAHMGFYACGIFLVSHALETWMQLAALKKQFDMSSTPNSNENRIKSMQKLRLRLLQRL